MYTHTCKGKGGIYMYDDNLNYCQHILSEHENSNNLIDTFHDNVHLINQTNNTYFVHESVPCSIMYMYLIR